MGFCLTAEVLCVGGASGHAERGKCTMGQIKKFARSLAPLAIVTPARQGSGEIFFCLFTYLLCGRHRRLQDRTWRNFQHKVVRKRAEKPSSVYFSPASTACWYFSTPNRNCPSFNVVWPPICCPRMLSFCPRTALAVCCCFGFNFLTYKFKCQFKVFVQNNIKFVATFSSPRM